MQDKNFFEEIEYKIELIENKLDWLITDGQHCGNVSIVSRFTSNQSD